MWILFLAIASFLLFLSIALVPWLTAWLEDRKGASQEEMHDLEPFTFLSISQAFEPIYAPLWASAFSALDLARKAGARGIKVSRLRSTFAEAATHFPEVYDGYEFEQWLSFFRNSGLIHWSGPRATLTCKGEEFLANNFTTDALVEK